MLLEETIRHYEGTAISKEEWADTFRSMGLNYKDYEEQAMRCRRLVGWLTELKRYREDL